MLELCDDPCQFWGCQQESIQGRLILCQSCDSSHNLQSSNFLFQCLVYKEVGKWCTRLLDAEVTFFESFSRLWTLSLQLIHLCQVQWHQSRIVVQIVCKEVFDLVVEGCQILFPVALSACPNDVQQTLNLLCVHHKEGTYFASIAACHGRLYAFRILFTYVIENVNRSSVMIVQTIS